MDENLKELTQDNFKEAISEGTTLVDFWAPWCVPCLMQNPILQRVAGSFGNKLEVTKINVDTNPGPASDFGITSIPTMILFKDGKMKKKFIGIQSEEVLTKEINNLK